MENEPIVKIFNLDPRRPAFSQLFYGISGAIFGASMFFAKNLFLKRPLSAGIQQHIVAAIIGGYVGHKFEHYSQEKMAERDAAIRHYISLHPEDFAPPERKLYKDIMRKWYPFR